MTPKPRKQRAAEHVKFSPFGAWACGSGSIFIEDYVVVRQKSRKKTGTCVDRLLLLEGANIMVIWDGFFFLVNGEDCS